MLTIDDYRRAATDLAVPVAAIRAVAEVESNGDGFRADGRPTILFERHIMRRQRLANRPADAAKLIAAASPDIVNTATGGYKGGAAEWDRLAAAIAIDRQSALESASWGMFQIMGFHWRELGYTSVQGFVNVMYPSAGAQLDAFVRFIKANPNRLRALRTLNWAAFAAGYNGPDYAMNKYDTKMASAFDRASKEIT